MNNIAILTCLKASEVCTGASCLEAFYSGKDYFSTYDEELRLKAFWHCNGCSEDPGTSEGIREKIDRLKKIGVTHVHVGVCAFGEKYSCKIMDEIIHILEQESFKVILGTHKY